MVRTAVLAAVLTALMAAPAAATTYSVTSTAATGPGTLDQAIQDANANPGADTIGFSVGLGGSQTLDGTFLTQITGAVTIDGSSQPGYAGTPLIHLPNGDLDVAASAVTLR